MADSFREFGLWLWLYWLGTVEDTTSVVTAGVYGRSHSPTGSREGQVWVFRKIELLRACSSTSLTYFLQLDSTS